MQTITATLVVERTQRSLHLLEGLRAALVKAGKEDLTEILELVDADLRAARDAAQSCQWRTRCRKDHAIVRDLKLLVRMGGAPTVPVALGLAQKIADR